MKLKISYKNYIKIIYGIIIIINIFTIFYIYNFTKKNIYGAIAIDEAIIASRVQKNIEDININRFNNIILKLEEKSKLEKIENIKNIFN